MPMHTLYACQYHVGACDNCMHLVRVCTCLVNGLVKERIEEFALQVWAYMATSHHLQQEHQRRQEQTARSAAENKYQNFLAQ